MSTPRYYPPGAHTYMVTRCVAQRALRLTPTDLTPNEDLCLPLASIAGSPRVGGVRRRLRCPSVATAQAFLRTPCTTRIACLDPEVITLRRGPQKRRESARAPMSDERLRELERRWKETGSAEDEAKYLLERVRVGDLEQEKLELAAYCGHNGARRALHDDEPAMPTDLRNWALGLQRWPREVCVRVGIALGRHLLTQQHHDELLRGAVAAAEDWVRNPSDESEDEADFWGAEALDGTLARAVGYLAGRVTPAAEDMPHRLCEQAVAAALRHSRPRTLLHAIRRELVPWCLGDADPLRDDSGLKEAEERPEGVDLRPLAKVARCAPLVLRQVPLDFLATDIDESPDPLPG